MSTIFHAQPKVPLLDQIRANIARNFPQPTDTNDAFKGNERNITSVGTGQLNVTVTPQQVTVVSKKRGAVKLTNLSPSMEVWWASVPGLIPGDGTQNGNGDLLPAGRGAWVAIPDVSVIWVACVASGVTQGNGVVSTGTARISWAEVYEGE